MQMPIPWGVCFSSGRMDFSRLLDMEARLFRQRRRGTVRLAIMYGLHQYRHLLLGHQFMLRTDHAALTYLLRTPNPVGQSARYLDKLAEFQFEVVHRPGLQHANADALSRRPCDQDPEAPTVQVRHVRRGGR